MPGEISNQIPDEIVETARKLTHDHAADQQIYLYDREREITNAIRNMRRDRISPSIDEELRRRRDRGEL